MKKTPKHTKNILRLIAAMLICAGAFAASGCNKYGKPPSDPYANNPTGETELR
ncbi:hypothetical protein [Cerasicoccus frondis]|uniref:hypothetical protein n=1 Tax=Cerasicoccus frondis TaxID=490090 RepID=UPI002852D930|nr:hypothetical protein [Cerasicoccus frondis]